MGLMKAILSFAMTSVKEYSWKLVAARIVEVVKDVMSCNVLTEMSSKSRYRYIRMVGMILRLASVLAVVEVLHGHDAGSKGQHV